MKKLLSILLVLSLVGAACMFAVSCTTPENKEPGATPTATSYVVLDINPTVEMTLTEDDMVISATASNDDAKVLLAQVSIEGKRLEDAAEALANESVELGFIAEATNSSISITVVGDTTELEEAIYNKIKDKFTTCVEAKCHFVLGVDKDVLLSLETELAELKAANPDNQAIQNLNVARYRMIVSAMEKDGTLTLETALTMETRDLLRAIRDGSLRHLEAELEKMEAEAELELELLRDQMYLEFNNAFIKAQATALVALREVEHQLEILEEYDLEISAVLTMTEAEVRQVASILELTPEETEAFVKKCEGLDGNYSPHNLKFAINCLYRNTAPEAREAFAEKYEQVEDYLETLEEEVKIPDSVVTAVKALASTVKQLNPTTEVDIPTDEELETYEGIEELIEALEDLVEDKIEALEASIRLTIKTGGLTEEEEQKLKELESKLKAKEAEQEREFERLEDELEGKFKENLNGWMNRHHGDK